MDFCFYRHVHLFFLFEAYFGVVDLDYGEGRRILRAVGAWENKSTLTTPEDIGKLTAAILFEDNPGMKNEIVYMAGERVSYVQVSNLVDEVLETKVQSEVWTVEALKEQRLMQKIGHTSRRRKSLAVHLNPTCAARDKMLSVFTARSQTV